MPGISVSKIPIPFNKGGGISWQTYWTPTITLVLAGASTSKISLSWNSKRKIKVERSANNINFTVIASLADGVTTYDDEAITAYNLYYYRVREYYGTHYSDYSNVISAGSADFVLNEMFLTDAVAPLATPRTAEPGPGTATVTAKWVINDGKLLKTAGDIPKQVYTGNSVAFFSGIALCIDFETGFVEANHGPSISLTSDNKPIINKFGVAITGNNYANTKVSAQSWEVSNRKWLILTSGYVFIVRDNRLLFAYPQNNTGKTVRALIDTFDTPFSAAIKSLKVAKLPAPWNTDDGIVSVKMAGARSEGDTFVHPNNAVIEFTVGTVNTTGNLDFRFRIQDDDNYWQLLNTDAGTVSLNEVVGGIPTARASGLNLIVNGSHCVITLDNTTITVILNNTYRFYYDSALNFRSETDGKLVTVGNGAVSDIVVFPRILPAAALYQLDVVNRDDVPFDALPIYDDDMTFYSGNPAITTALTGTNGFTCADPYLFIVNGKLYCVFESTLISGQIDSWGEVWMAESVDGFVWTNPVKISTVAATHYAHPTVFIEDGTVHVYMLKGNGFIVHRSSPVSGFPNFGAESNVFDSETYGWPHMREFEIFKHTDGNYYLLGITSNVALTEDQYLRGKWSATLPTNWNTGGNNISASPLIDIADSGWGTGMVEVTALASGGRLILYFGVTKGGVQNIGVYEVTELTPNKFTGSWIVNDHTFRANPYTGWEWGRTHRMSSVYYRDKWIVAYDACYNNSVWRIGIATR
jgi:hypothetical protein